MRESVRGTAWACYSIPSSSSSSSLPSRSSSPSSWCAVERLVRLKSEVGQRSGADFNCARGLGLSANNAGPQPHAQGHELAWFGSN